MQNDERLQPDLRQSRDPGWELPGVISGFILIQGSNIVASLYSRGVSSCKI